MENISIWESFNNNIEKEIKSFNTIDTDILIIGGGLTGLLSAYFLKDTSYKITLIDKSTIGSGITSKTTAKISYLEQDIYQKLTKMHNISVSKKYYESRKEAINIIVNIINNHNIKCDLEKTSSVLFADDCNNINKLNKEKELLSSFGVDYKEYSDKQVKNGIIVDDTYTFNPLKYLNGIRNIIKSKVNIYENTLATSIKKSSNKYIINTNNGVIYSEKIVLACHYPFFIIPFFFPLKTYIEREYVCAAKITNPKKITMINIDKYLYSVRYYKDYIIYASHDHRLTSQIDYGNNYLKSRKQFIKLFNTNPTYSWMNQDIISNDELPFIGKIKDNIYISTAYHAWGMTNSVLGGKIIADIIQNKDNEYIKLFNPTRLNLPIIINSFIGVFHYIKVYIESLFHKNNPKYVKIKGIIYGIYTDKKGIEHRVKLICPHMKCLLVFNKEELTWDCPCHGSRFDIDGNIISIPSVKKIQ